MSEANPLVSIVIPSYNYAEFVDEAIRSVFAQRYPRVELIVLDDGSTDDTRAVLAKHGSALHWETHPNMGQAATLNKGWGLARGELLGYLSADDALLPEAVDTLVECLRANPDAVLAYPDFNLIDPRSHFIREVNAPEYSYYEMVVDAVCAPGPGALFRRRVFEAAGGWDTTLRQVPDYEYWLRLGLQGRFVRVPKVLALHRVHEESQSYARSARQKAEEPRKVLAQYLRRPDLPAEVAPFRRRALGQAHILTARLHWRAGRWFTALLRLAQAFAIAPVLAFRKRTVLIVIDSVVDRTLHRILWRLNRRRSRS